jgi:hypothetical protein
MCGMFCRAENFNSDLSGRDLSKVKYKGSMFRGANNFKGEFIERKGKYQITYNKN